MSFANIATRTIILYLLVVEFGIIQTFPTTRLLIQKGSSSIKKTVFPVQHNTTYETQHCAMNKYYYFINIVEYAKPFSS